MLLAGLAVTALAGTAMAQSLSLDFGDGDGSTTGRIVQLIAVLTVLSLAPGILVTVTSFTRIVIVLSLLRTALGTQQSPPNIVMVSLALFLSAFIMAPAFTAAWQNGLSPLIEERIDEATAFEEVTAPFRTFMLNNVRDKDLQLFQEIADLDDAETGAAAPLQVLVPAFMISELRRAFEIGFLLYLPFIVIDMIIASILMSMGMMMLPPVIVSLPFKLIFFVLIDGWYMVVGSLVKSFSG
ncbi:MAG: flagellar type III secretion system pore protein FliP [Pseudomonadota bacterium]|nr:flagellar type III secretion system pore protein FliP [Pseudomonadota bacterium]MEC8386770.1 flagellar type III secretion system pore protein FliP [Pseudomonadota bacterium]